MASMKRTTSRSTTATLCDTPAPRPTPSPIPPPVDVVSVFDPASTGGGGPLVRIATAHSQRSAARDERRRSSGTSARLPLFALTPLPTAPDTKDLPAVFVETADEKKDIDETERGGPTEAELHEYPDGGYGWVVVAACVTLCALTNGWGTAYGVFQEYYSKHTFASAPTSVLSLTGTFQYFCAGAFAFISGRMGDRYGFKRMLFLATLVCWLGIFAASFSKSLWSTILCQGFIAGMGQGIALPLFMSLPSQWFYKHRGLASGMVTGGSGIGGGIFTIAVRRLLTQVGPSKTLLIMSFVVAGGMVVCTSILRVRPTSPEAGKGRGPIVNTKVLKTPEFWSVALSLIIGCMGYVGPFTFISQYTAKNFHLSDDKTALPLTVLSFTSLAGRVLVGVLADRAGPLNTYVFVFAISGVMQLALWLTANSFGQIMAFVVMYGLVAPGYLGIIPQIVVTIFGPGELASNVGLLLLFNSPGQLASGPLGGAVYDSTGRTTFSPMIAMTGSLQLCGGLIALYARFRTSPKLFSKI